MNVGKDTALSDGDMTEELIQFFIIADSKLEMARNDAGLLIVTGSIAGQLKDLGSQVF